MQPEQLSDYHLEVSRSSSNHRSASRLSVGKSSVSGQQRTSTRVSVKSRKSSKKHKRKASARSRRSGRSLRNNESPPDLLLGDRYSQRGGNSYRSSQVEQRNPFEQIYADAKVDKVVNKLPA